MPAVMQTARGTGRVLRGGGAMLALSVAMLLPACSPAGKEAEQGNETAAAADPSAPEVAVAAPSDPNAPPVAVVPPPEGEVRVVIPVAADSVTALPDCSSSVETHCVLNRKSPSR